MRLALREFIKVKPGDEVLLPAYLFQELLDPFLESGIKVKYYKVGKDLSLDAADVKKKMSAKTKVLLIIHYFGFPQKVDGLESIRQSHPDCAIMEDVTLSFLTCGLDSSLGRFGDYCFNLYLKQVPMPDGSALIINNPSGTVTQDKWRLLAARRTCLRYMAMNLKNIYLKTHLVPKGLYRWFFNRAGLLQNERPLTGRISCLSRWLLDKHDYDSAIVRRRHNYNYLQENWQSKELKPLFPKLPEKVCPLGFIVLAKNRDRIRRQLAEAGIYCPAHWLPSTDKSGERLPADIGQKEYPASWEAAAKIMMIPIDQRYGVREMDYILATLKRLERESPER